MTFEWNQNKNQNNKKFIIFHSTKHHMLSLIAKELFIKHSIAEERFFCIGKIENGIATVRRSF